MESCSGLGAGSEDLERQALRTRERETEEAVAQILGERCARIPKRETTFRIAVSTSVNLQSQAHS